MNRANPPTELKGVRAFARDGYGWTEFINHTGCADQEGCKRFFQRAGAWLALFHCFVGNDMHQENMIAAGDHPVPIDLETILQSTTEEHEIADPEAQASDLATEKLANSVMMVGLLPAYGRTPDNKVFAMGGMTADWNSKIKIKWDNINSDEMRPTRSKETSEANPNLPHVDGRYARLADHIDDLVSGFEDYAKFLQRQGRDAKFGDMYEGFAGLPVRKVVRATRFYSMLLQRLKNSRTMDDGATWSAQADFMARLAEWDKNTDVFWPLQRAERSALLALNVPHFVSPSDENEIHDASRPFYPDRAAIRASVAPATRIQNFDEREIDWQIEVIRENTRSLSKSADPTAAGQAQSAELLDLTALADKESIHCRSRQDRRRAVAIMQFAGAWCRLDRSRLAGRCRGLSSSFAWGRISTMANQASHCFLPRTRLLRVVSLLPNSPARRCSSSKKTEKPQCGANGPLTRRRGRHRPGLDRLCAHRDVEVSSRRQLCLRMPMSLRNYSSMTSLQQTNSWMSSVAAPVRILCLLRLYRDSQSADVLNRAIKCGEHLIAQSRLGPEGRRSWVGQGMGKQALNGMSHGAAGFAYALASLSAATGREEFAQAASECIAFEEFELRCGPQQLA